MTTSQISSLIASAGRKRAGLLLSCLLVAAGTRTQAQDFTLFGCTAEGKIYEVDPVGQTSTQVADFGQFINGLAWVPEQNRLYFSNTVGDPNAHPGDGSLFYWDRVTGNFSTAVLNPSDLAGEMDNGSYYDGAIWYADGNGLSDSLFRMDVNTLAITEFTNFDGTARTKFDFGDLVVDSAGMISGYAWDNDTNQGSYFRVDISSGIPTSYTETYSNFLYQLGIDPLSDALYATSGANGGGGEWFTVDATSGTMTSISGFITPQFTDLSGRGALPIPEPSGAALLAVGGLAGLGRRRRNAAP